MTCSRLLTALLTVAAISVISPSAEAQGRARRGGEGGAGIRQAVPRGAVVPRGTAVPRRPVIVAPRIIGAVPYRSYYYGYRPGLTVGFYAGYPYRYPYYSRYGYGYPYPPYGYGDPYGYGYSGGYPYFPAGYVTTAPGFAYGVVRIEGAPPDAQVFADGYYVGVVDDFDGAFQHLNLQAGPHRIEIRAPGLPEIAFDVNVQPGQTITYRVPRP